MNVVAGQHTFDNFDAILRTYLTADITDPQAQLALQYLEPVFRGRFFALKRARLEDGGFRPRSGY